MADFLSQLGGTLLSIFQIGKDGPQLKESSGNLDLRNGDDTAFVALRVADGTSPNDAVTKSQLDAVGGADVGAGIPFGIGGKLPTSQLPRTTLAPSLATNAANVSSIAARRLTAGNSGTTTIQLEVNGSPVSGASLSWTSADADQALKTASFTSTAVAQHDLISFRLTSAERGAQDIVGVLS